jgi:hypothetical protein
MRIKIFAITLGDGRIWVWRTSKIARGVAKDIGN